jgi:hypothetical protein
MAKKKQWELGHTLVTTTNAKYEDMGEIVADQGAIWYSVKLSNTQEIVKIRSNQLQSMAERHTTASSNQPFESTPGPTLKADAGWLAEFPPPVPFIQDLETRLEESQADTPLLNPTKAEHVKQVAYHTSFNKWVVFTDLHCCALSTLDTTLRVLEYNEGLLFLGDFWHHHAEAVHVNYMKPVLKSFSKWQARSCDFDSGQS